MLGLPMKADLERTVVSVTREAGVWRASHDGEEFGHSTDKEIAKAAAHRHARSMFDAGRPCQVRIAGEHGQWQL